MSATQAGRTPWRTVAGDIVTFIGGWVLLFQQALFVPPAEVNEFFILVAAALVGVPLGAEGLARARGTAASPPDSPDSPS